MQQSMEIKKSRKILNMLLSSKDIKVINKNPTKLYNLKNKVQHLMGQIGQKGQNRMKLSMISKPISTSPRLTKDWL